MGRRRDPARSRLRLGTLIRHAGRFQPLAILALPIPMIEPAFPALLMTAVGLPPLLAARLLAATRAAVTLTMITTGTEIKHDPAPFGTAELLAENNRRDRHPAAKTSLSRQTLDSRRHSCEDHLTLVEWSSSQEEHRPTKNPGCLNNRGLFSRRSYQTCAALRSSANSRPDRDGRMGPMMGPMILTTYTGICLDFDSLG